MSTTQKPKITSDALKQFTGTEYYRLTRKDFFLTDGAYYIADNAEAFWLFDAIASHLFFSKDTRKYRDNLQGLFWKLVLTHGNSADLICSYDTDCQILTQSIEFTDFFDYVEMSSVDIWTFPTAGADEKITWIAMVPSEY